MAREKKIIIGALNIVTQPHSTNTYINLFKDANKLRNPVCIAGDQYGMISGVFKLDSNQDKDGPITGDIYKFTNIDKDANWFDTSKNDFANEDDLGEINIPDNLKPNSSKFTYIFFPEQHILFYEAYYDGKKLGSSSAVKFFQKLFNQIDIIKKFGTVEVTHVPSKDELKKALALPYKEFIEMSVTRPNPDDHSIAEQKVLRRMNAANVETYEQRFKASEGKAIQMDADMTTMAHIAAKNGNLSIKGKNDNLKTIKYSTIEHPWQDQKYYDPEAFTAFQVMSVFATTMVDTIVSWFRQ